MGQLISGLLLLLFLALPPVADFMESIMIVHMHMQMPLLVLAGCLIARYFQLASPSFFEKWNGNGLPGILLFSVIMVYWMIPRTMDEALTVTTVEIFKYISLPFLAGIPLRDSWPKLSSFFKNILIFIFALIFSAVGPLYIVWPTQLCNNYLIIEQITLGWGFLTMGACMFVYLIYDALVDSSAYQ
jgi:hypothetical protein